MKRSVPQGCILRLMRLTFVFAGLAFAGSVSAAEPEGLQMPKPSAGLEAMKTLAGRWEGPAPADSGHGEKVVVDYKVTSGGSAVTETMSPGTAHEMVSVYHDVNGKLSMEHYCMLGNQPQMQLKSTERGRMNFEESPASLSTLKGQMRMNGLTLELLPDGTMVQSWSGVGAKGEPMPKVEFKLKKVA